MFFAGMEGLKSMVSDWVGGHSSLGPLCEFVACVSEFLKLWDEEIGGFGIRVGLFACRV